ncbi:Uncharacterised protein [Sphingobacterium spiritivorum]|uniref:Uncharacterized protein n=1 Tax=Sphingobacterium spiritivorum TaxID=258 RepID=A0A380CU96_SPHSI|nr:hypothetical protein [Sphingobacterium spiritivorum]SUJ29124.1 Uncharacterised protein [Sphingobacterium spiritivorum]
MNNRSIKLLQACLLICIVMILTIMQGYWALWEYRTAPSSSCLDCSFFPDLMISSLLPLLGMAVIHLVFVWIKPRLMIRAGTVALTLILCWYLIDTAIFDEREASWSTYTDLWAVSLYICALQIITFGLIAAGVYYKLYSKKTPVKRTYEE